MVGLFDLPPELISSIVVEIVKDDILAIGNMSVVCKEWNVMMMQPFIWLSLCMDRHGEFLSSFQDSINLIETMQSWKEGKQEEPEHTLAINWQDKFLEWEMLDEIVTVSVNIFQDQLELRMTTAEIIRNICASRFLSLNVIMEFVPNVRSDLKAAAAIGITSKFHQIAEEYPQYANKQFEESEHFPLDITPTALLRLQLADKTAGFNESLLPVVESLEIIMNVGIGGNFDQIDFPPIFQVLVEYLHILLDDRASRVSYRAIEAVGQLKPICILFGDKLQAMATHYNPAVAELANSYYKSSLK